MYFQEEAAEEEKEAFYFYLDGKAVIFSSVSASVEEVEGGGDGRTTFFGETFRCVAGENVGPVPTTAEGGGLTVKSIDLSKHIEIGMMIFDQKVKKIVQQMSVTGTDHTKRLFEIQYAGMSYVVILGEESPQRVGARRRQRIEKLRILGETVEIELEFGENHNNNNNAERRTRTLDLLWKKGLSFVDNCPLSTVPVVYDVVRKKDNSRGRRRRSGELELPWYRKSQTCLFHWLRDEETCQQQQQHSEEEKNKRRGKELSKFGRKRDCIFVMGVGMSENISGPPLPDWPAYWGKAKYYVTEQCNSTLFLREETQLRGWDNVELQKDVCKYLTDNTGIIRDKIIFSHSMGNNIVGGALWAGRCQIETNSSSWIQIQPPIFGSPAANWMIKVCQNPAEWTDLIKDIVTFFGYCHNGKAWPAYYTLKTDYNPLLRLAQSKLMDNFGDARECGTSPWGLTSSKYSWYMEGISTLSMKGAVNDGMVRAVDCETKAVTYGKDFHDTYYSAAINHADGPCHDGNGWFGKDRMPCSWMTYRGK